jgi:lysine-N-methylase
LWWIEPLNVGRRLHCALQRPFLRAEIRTTMSNAQTPATAFRYMSRFKCIGGACEDTCCAGWEIQVDQSHYKKLKQAMSSTKGERAEFEAAHRRTKGNESSRGKFALMVLKEDKRCSFLRDDKLCATEARYGAAVLSDTCALYPRSIGQVGARLEMAGSPSCPEVARLLLLDDAAMDLVEVRPDAIGRPLISRQLAEAPASPYLRHHTAINHFVCALLSVSGYPLATRLFFAAYFANRTAPFLFDGAKELDEPRLAAEIETLESGPFLAELHAGLRSLNVKPDLALKLVFELAALGSAERTPFRDLVATSLRRCAEAAGADGTATEIPGPVLLEGYERLRARWEPILGARVDRALTNYAKNYWMKDWYVQSPNLLVHAQGLALRIAILRFLVFGHALIADAECGTREEQEAAVDRAVVDVVQRFSRRFEHDARFLKAIEQYLAKQDMQTLAHTIVLLRF